MYHVTSLSEKNKKSKTVDAWILDKLNRLTFGKNERIKKNYSFKLLTNDTLNTVNIYKLNLVNIYKFVIDNFVESNVKIKRKNI